MFSLTSDCYRHALTAALLSAACGANAMQPLDDEAMADISGAGIALAFEDFRWLTAPTSYFEQMGSDPVPLPGETSTVWQRADMRWYGLSITAVPEAGSTASQDVGFHWAGNGAFGAPCTEGGLACPLGGQIARFAAYDNPYVMRAWSPHGFTYTGQEVNTDSNNPDITLYEYVAPTNQPYYNFAFWGEIEAGRTGPNEILGAGHGDFLKSQTLIQGNAAGSVFRMFQHTQPGNETFAMMYHSHLRGDFRFSVAQQNADSSDIIGQPVIFDEREGLHFKNVDAFIPLGQSFYQALTLGPADTPGNFILEVPRLRDHDAPGFDATTPLGPNDNHIRHFYSYAVDETLPDAGYITARLALLENTPGADVQAYKNLVSQQYGIPLSNINLPESYHTTHGYSRWGNWYPCQGIGCPTIHSGPASHPDRNSFNATDSGIFFRKCEGCDDFDAFAYMLTAVDVRAGQSQYSCPGGDRCGEQGYNPRGLANSNRNNGTPGTPHNNNSYASGRYYALSASCNANGDAARCGYGGSYNINAAGNFQFVQGKLDPSTLYGVSSQPYIQRGACNTVFGICTGNYQQLPPALPVIRTDVVNLGDARIEGLQVNYVKFTSYGAGNLQ